MPPAKFTKYYKDAMDKMLDYLDVNQQLAFRIDEIKGETVVITIGVSDGNNFILEFGTVALRIGYITHVKADSIHIDMHTMIRMQYYDNTGADVDLPLIEAWNGKAV